jgi:hypothetical protein
MIVPAAELSSDTPDRGWRRASRCASSGCVEILMADGRIEVRDSKQSDGPVLTYFPDEWITFIGAVKAGEFDLPIDNPADAVAVVS